MKHVGHDVIRTVKQGMGSGKKKFVHMARLYDIWPEVYEGFDGLPALPSRVYINNKTTPRTMKIVISCPSALAPRLAMQKGVLLEKINFLMGDPKAIDITFDHRL